MRQTYGALCALAEQHGVKMTEEVRALLRAVERDAEAEADAQPIAWESTTPFYRKYLTQAKYDRLGDQFRKWYKPYRCSNCAAPAPVPHIKTMVDRFLGWRLPDDFAPDCGISFTPLGHPNGWPVGTNLLTAAQAEAMFRHALGLEKITACCGRRECGGECGKEWGGMVEPEERARDALDHLLNLAHEAFGLYVTTAGGSPVAHAAFMRKMQEFNDGYAAIVRCEVAHD